MYTEKQKRKIEKLISKHKTHGTKSDFQWLENDMVEYKGLLQLKKIRFLN